ncbi:hypothetical protein DVH24_002507 [Malus domestica]|uniref:Phosphoglycerate mutase-like protein 1 n=1 Tax=Malus domestica TaxID=3750 RepID=A0A498IQD8_MALDO|nr:hypothetical protein DVH24_002507 [Malus domestica]
MVEPQLSSLGHSRLSSFWPFCLAKSLHCGLTTPFIQVRHGQGIHNVEGAKNYKAYMKPEYFDAQLTPLGWQQVDNLRKHVHECGLSKRIELVITSPLLRTLQTAVGVFGGEGYKDGMDVLPLMVENAGNSERPSISSLNCPPIIAVELCREHLGDPKPTRLLALQGSGEERLSSIKGVNPQLLHIINLVAISNIYGRKLSFLRQIETDEDVLWEADVRETTEEVAARGMKFMNWLWTRKEKEIAIVTHNGFLFHTLNALGNDCHPSMKKEMSTHFANCELRSMIIVDRSMTGSDLSTTDYPGKIPPGPDLPSDVADEKKREKEKDRT